MSKDIFKVQADLLSAKEGLEKVLREDPLDRDSKEWITYALNDVLGAIANLNRAEGGPSKSVKLTSKRFDRNVIVSFEDPGNLESALSEIQNEAAYPVGTEAILLDIRSYPDFGERVAWVFLDGRWGWVWENEVEYI